MRNGVIFWLCLLWSTSLLADDAKKPLLIFAEDPDSSHSGGLRKRLAKLEFVEFRSLSGDDLKASALEDADLIVLKDIELSDEQQQVMIDRVRRGTSLFVLSARSSLGRGEEWFSLLGGVAVKKSGRELRDLAVAVLNQRHPVTQCVTHFEHRGSPRSWTFGPRTEVLASAVAARSAGADVAISPVIWVTDHGRARVFVCLLSPETGESSGLLATLLERAVQWGLGERVTIPLDAKSQVKWVAESLGSGDVGLVRQRSPEPGFFRGRQIAPFMTHHGAGWLVRADRAESEKPEKVLDSLDIKSGQVVVDLGCGNGYFTLRMARRVGETGKVLGVDIQKEMLDLLVQRASEAGLKNVEPVLAKENDPRLPENSVDLVLMVDTYHELARPAEVLGYVLRALRKGGRVVLVEYRGEDPTVMIKPLHRMTERQARAELEAMGFRWVITKDFLPHQHILIFEKT